MKAVTHLEKVIAGEVSAVTHLEKVIAQETTAVTYTEKVIAGTAPPVTHLQKVIAGEARPVTHLEYVWAGGSPPSVQEYTGAVPVTFVADGTPLLDYIISGNTVQSGTPTPDSPIMPQGTGERTGNLAPPLTEWVDGYVSASGAIAPPSEDYKEKSSDYISVEAGRAYTFSVGNKFPGGAYYPWRAIGWYTQDKTFISRASGNAGGALSTSAPSDAVYCRLSYRTHGETTNPMLNLGSTPLPYEPYGYKIPISSANTTTNVYLGEVQTTRKVKKLVLTGEETLTSGSVIGQIRTPLTGTINSLGLCTHYILKTSYGGAFPYIRIVNNILWFEISPDGYETKEEALADFNSYLAVQYAAGTPVTIWYVLATEETGIVNEPLMKIGEYADTLSMEQASVEIPTARGTNTLDVLTDVKPSEVYIKYRGEAVATLSSLPAEVSSPEGTPEEADPEETEETENGSEDVSLQYKPEAIE